MERKQKWSRTQEEKDKDESKLNHNREEIRGKRKIMRSRALSGEKHNKLLFGLLKKLKVTWLAV